METNQEETLQAIQKSVAHIQGWFDDLVGRTLYQLIRWHAPTDIVVELGSWKGKSTVWLASAIRDKGQNGKVYAVDTWRGTENNSTCTELLKGYKDGQLFDEFLNNIKNADLLDVVEPIINDTIEASRQWSLLNPIGLLFIDACHEYEAVRKDFEFWSPFVAVGGFIAFHDVPGWPGPSRLVTELPDWYEFTDAKDGIWIGRKIV